jgi:hypothetical protein
VPSQQTTSTSTAVSHEHKESQSGRKQSTSHSSGLQAFLSSPIELDPINPRSVTPGLSSPGHEIEAQIMEGGGLANIGSRAGAKQLEPDTPITSRANSGDERFVH